MQDGWIGACGNLEILGAVEPVADRGPQGDVLVRLRQGGRDRASWAVRTIAPAPTWTYDPSRLNFGDKSTGKLTIAAGPNNPVGAVWIDLTKDTYGLHGSPDPELVGNVASHGCVRLTNWNAEQLSEAVSQGTKVVVVGKAAPKKAWPGQILAGSIDP